MRNLCWLNPILRAAAERHGKDSLPEKLIGAIAHVPGVARVEDDLRDRVARAEAMLGVAKQDGSRVGSGLFIGALDFDGAVEKDREQVMLSFTHREVFFVFERCCFLLPSTCVTTRRLLSSAIALLAQYSGIGERR